MSGLVRGCEVLWLAAETDGRYSLDFDAKLFEQFDIWSVDFYGSAATALVARAMAIGLVNSRANSRAAAAAPAPAK